MRRWRVLSSLLLLIRSAFASTPPQNQPGKDSYELRKAGAAQTIVASQQRWALMTETPDEEELDLHFLASRMDTSKLDLILVEGFKHEEIAKIVLFRDGAGHRPEELVIDRHVLL